MEWKLDARPMRHAARELFDSMAVKHSVAADHIVGRTVAHQIPEVVTDYEGYVI